MSNTIKLGGIVGDINKATKSAIAPRSMWKAAKVCEKCSQFADIIDKVIYHKNNHVWPRCAGDPDGGKTY